MVEADEKTIRQYLLGEMAEAEMVPFEERLMTEDLLFEMLLVVEDELIDERAEGALSAEEQARFDAYFLATPQRRERLLLAQGLHDYAAQPADKLKLVANLASGSASGATTNATQSENASERVAEEFSSPVPMVRPSPWSSPRRYLGLAAAALILVAAGLGVRQIFFPTSDMSKGLQALNQAYREQRPTEARITELNYAPPPPRIRGNQQEKVDYVARDRAERIFLDAVAGHPDAQSYHALGRLYLAKHKFDEAIKQFDEASKLDANNAQLENDIGAAYLEKGKANRSEEAGGKSTEYFEESLKHLTRSIELNDSLLQAHFNRALLYGYMNRTQEAQNEWRNYIKKDQTSEWAEEANRQLKSLEK
jgi:Tetratricopeptide repeat.